MTDVTAQRYGRRAFLVRTGVIGAAIALVDVPTLLEPGRAGAAAPSLATLSPIFDALSKDTINGLVAFVVPGPDAYSVAQGMHDTAPGGLDADGTAFMLNALDNFYPVPQEPLLLLVQALTTGINANLPSLHLPPLLEELADELDKALQVLLAGETTVPLSLLVALLLNFVATLTNPTAVHGTFLSPFARLDFTEKTKAFQLMETDAANLAVAIDGNLTEPVRASISGLIEFLAGALLEFAAFGCFSEFGAFDAQTRTVMATPVGWTLSNYLALAPNNRPVEGWDEFKGYLGGETQASE
ncbi:MAG TPA: hypothetical protein VG346_03670 [Acidimicrobiales bacterium]|nr:hypothetical protein [Acidimicrobiales bacterium]